MATIVKGKPKALFLIATTHLGVGEGMTPFPGLLHFILDTYLIMLGVKQAGIKYYFLSLWYDVTWEWTPVIYIYIYIYCHPQTDCFILSELFSVARPAGRSKPGSKPVYMKDGSLYLPSHCTSVYMYINRLQFLSLSLSLYIYIYIYIYIWERECYLYSSLNMQWSRSISANKRMKQIEWKLSI